MYVTAGQPFTATLIDPGGLTEADFGARIEVPVTRAIVGAWTAAGLDGLVWSVTMDAPPERPSSQATYALGESPIYRAELAAGEFNLVWMDSLDPPAVQIFVPLFTSDSGGISAPTDWPAPDVEQCTPTVADVARLERTRTVDKGGNELTGFNADTRPSDTEVASLIDQAVQYVLASLRPTFPATYYPQVKEAAALYAAVLIEGSFFREQASEGSAQLYRQLFASIMAGISSSLQIELTDQMVGRLV